MKPFIFEKWHAWEGTYLFVLSDETKKSIRYFETTDKMINWLFTHNNRPAARALHAHIKKG